MIKFLDLSITNEFERERLQDVLRQHMDSGRFIIKDEETEFEKRFKDIHGRKHAVAVKTGTDALILSLMLLDIPKDNYIITASFSWLATSSAIKLAGHNPYFVDTDDMLNMDLDQVEEVLANSELKVGAVLVPHLHGNAVDLMRLARLRDEYNIHIIEDCAQSFSAADNKKRVTGTTGCISCFSFNPMKVLPALGDGGLILFDNPKLLERAYRLRHSGMTGQNNICPELSRNFRMDMLQAAVLDIRLDFHNEKVKERRKLVRMYMEELPELIRVVIEKLEQSNHYVLQTILPGNRKQLINYLQKNDVESKIRHNFLIPDLKPFMVDKKMNLNNSRKLVEKTLCLPLHNRMDINDVKRVCSLVSNFYGTVS